MAAEMVSAAGFDGLADVVARVAVSPPGLAPGKVRDV
jgi:hypothetical protein